MGGPEMAPHTPQTLVAPRRSRGAPRHPAKPWRPSIRRQLLHGPANLGGRLVVAQAEKGGMAELAVTGLLHESDLGDEPRLEPGRVTHARRVDERRRRATKRRKALREIGQRLAGEAGAHLARVAQPAVVEGADQQRAEVRARALWRRVAADHELLLRADLHLAPCRGALAGLVRRRLVLGHDALEPALARRLERLEPVAGQAPGEAQWTGGPHFLLEDGPALRERQPPQIAAARVEHVEDDV